MSEHRETANAGESGRLSRHMPGLEPTA